MIELLLLLLFIVVVALEPFLCIHALAPRAQDTVKYRCFCCARALSGRSNFQKREKKRVRHVDDHNTDAGR